jgi:hypothetical protein
MMVAPRVVPIDKVNQLVSCTVAYWSMLGVEL